jgi:polyhydroxybutyrate depolymerase
MGCRQPRRIAAVGMVAATLVSLCPVDEPMPAIAFHGTADPVVPYGGGMVNGLRSGTDAPGAEGAIAQWAQRNGCGATPTETKPAADVVHRVWTGCTDGASVEFYSIVGGGHTWPGALDVSKIGKGYLGATTQSVSATKVFLDFFDQVR